MITPSLTLLVLEGSFAVCKFDRNAAVPEWATSTSFYSLTRTPDEVSIVCSQEVVPDGVTCERDWRCLRVAGTLDFTAIGILASLLAPLAKAGVSVFVSSTYDTDYLLVKGKNLTVAIESLQQAGHVIVV